MCDPHAINAFTPEYLGEHWSEPILPESDGFVANIDSVLGQQVQNAAQSQGIAHIRLHDELDDLWRAVEVAEGVLHQPKVVSVMSKAIWVDRALLQRARTDRDESGLVVV